MIGRISHKATALVMLAALSAILPDGARADAENWRMLDNGSVTFVAVQAGAPFEGRFERFAASIRFAPDALDSSAFEVEIELASVDTEYAERDDILRGSEFFHAQAHPLAVYEASRFTALGDGKYLADGSLRIKGKNVPTAVTFTFMPADDDTSVRILDGATSIDRLDFDLGLGDWREDKWVGHTVEVRFRLRLGVIPDLPSGRDGA